MSRDLVARGIAAQNMTPNSPSLDARPLFQAALDYVRNSGGVTTVRAAHLVELRACVDAVRLHYGLPAYPYADLSVGSTPTVIKGQLRSAIRVLDPVLH